MSENQTEFGHLPIPGLAASGEPCWYAQTTAGHAFEYGDGAPHWQSEDEGRAFLASIVNDYNDALTATLHRLSEPCWRLACDECGYRYEEDAEASHFSTQADARAVADECDWHIVDGRLLCSECVYEMRTPSGEQS